MNDRIDADEISAGKTVIPSATYRLQLNKDFTFAHARALVPYLDDLGISHVYLSPILRARPGSTHGYDTVDHGQINPELGSIDDFRALAGALREHTIGIILDIVPNHMGVGGADNAIWLDVLKHGPDSRYADWFDIDWHPPHQGMDGKLLVPFLGHSYAETLAAGELLLKEDGDGLAVWAYDEHKLPIRPADASALIARHGSLEAAVAAHTGSADHPGSWTMLADLIATQHWRPAHFSVAADEINYRRFFINSDLAGIRVDRPEVFDHVHALTFSLIEEGLVDGLRIDHIDGLLDPKGYLTHLREKSPRPVYLIVEKILGPHEPLRPEWPVEGTTGYEVGAQLTRVLMPSDSETAVSAAYHAFVGPKVSDHEETYRCKVRVMDNELAAELDALARRFAGLAQSVLATRDLTQLALRRAIREVIAQFAVYRTYVDDAEADSRDLREIGRAVALGRRNQPQIDPPTFDFVEALLTETLGPEYDPRLTAQAIGRFQQYTGPVIAKGLEDTALYRNNRLVALNEVGAHPDRYSITIEAFHDSNIARLAAHPHSMVATSTHDTKRGEDTRAIIAAIADEPQVWSDGVSQWPKLLNGSDAIYPEDLYLFFQLLLGGWPLEGSADDIGERLKAAMTKSVREARLRSDWGVPATDYENALAAFIDDAMSNAAFLASFHQVRAVLQPLGRRRALIQAALKLTIPGIPDIYRGAEDWEQSFVDPDNRRALDFEALARRLASPEDHRDEKLILTKTLLQLRRRLPQLFSAGSYEPIDCGPGGLGFRRQHACGELVVLADLTPEGSTARHPDFAGLSVIAGGDDAPYRIMLGEPASS